MKQRVIVFSGIVALLLVLFSGCATVTRGTNDLLVVESEPPGATVKVSNGMVGTTPTSFKLPRKNDVHLTISKEGYETLEVDVRSGVSGGGAAGMAGNVLVGGLIGMGVDAVSGATKSLLPNPVQVTLVPLGATPVAPPAQEEAPTEEPPPAPAGD